SSVLGVDRVGSQDCSAELGGHSLLATQVVARLRDATGIELAVGALFEHPVLADLARHAESVRGMAESRAPLQRRERGEGEGEQSVPLSFAQQRLWFLDQLAPGSPLYNIPTVLRLHGTLQPAALEQSLQA